MDEKKPTSFGRHQVRKPIKTKRCPCKKRIDLLNAAKAILRVASREGVDGEDFGNTLWNLKMAVKNCEKKKPRK